MDMLVLGELWFHDSILAEDTEGRRGYCTAPNTKNKVNE